MSEEVSHERMERTLGYIEHHRANAVVWVKQGDYAQASKEVEAMRSLAQGLEERLQAVLAAVLVVACAVVVLAVSEKAEAAFPGQNGKIAYTQSTGTFNEDIFTMNPDGTDRRQLTFDSELSVLPDYSPDGTKIAFESLRSGVNKIYVMNADGTGVKNLSGSEYGDSSPAWSPDGKKIAFTHRSDIWVMNADGSGRTNLTNTGPVNGYSVAESRPTWSPDGTRVAYSKRTCRPCDVDLYVMNADGTRVVQITDNLGKEYSPDWSPSGRRIVFYMSTRAKGTRIFTIRPDGTGRRLVTYGGESPVWSPDGTKIAFTREGDTWTVNVDGTGESNVTDTPRGVIEILPDWGPKPTPSG